MMPATAPNPTENRIATITSRQLSRKSVRFDDAVAALIRLVRPQPRSNPMPPPMLPINTASSRYSRRMCPTLAPTAFFSPISRTRSVAAVSMEMITERPPTTSAMSAAPVVMAVKIAPPALKLATSTLGLVAFTPGTSALILSASLSRSTPGLPYTVAPLTSFVVSMLLRILTGRVSFRSIWASVRLTYAPVSGAVCVLARIPTTVKVWFTKSGGASLARLGGHAHVGEGRGDAVDLFQSRDPVERQQAATKGADRAAGAVCHLDVRAEISRASREQRVELLRHGAHRDQGEHTDHDAADGQDVAQLAPR